MTPFMRLWSEVGRVGSSFFVREGTRARRMVGMAVALFVVRGSKSILTDACTCAHRMRRDGAKPASRIGFG